MHGLQLRIDLFGPEGAKAHSEAMDALHRFAQATGALGGQDVIQWMSEQTERWIEAAREAREVPVRFPGGEVRSIKPEAWIDLPVTQVGPRRPVLNIPGYIVLELLDGTFEAIPEAAPSLKVLSADDEAAIRKAAGDEWDATVPRWNMNREAFVQWHVDMATGKVRPEDPRP